MKIAEALTNIDNASDGYKPVAPQTDLSLLKLDKRIQTTLDEEREMVAIAEEGRRRTYAMLGVPYTPIVSAPLGMLKTKELAPDQVAKAADRAVIAANCAAKPRRTRSKEEMTLEQKADRRVAAVELAGQCLTMARALYTSWLTVATLPAVGLSRYHYTSHHFEDACSAQNYQRLQIAHALLTSWTLTPESMPDDLKNGNNGKWVRKENETAAQKRDREKKRIWYRNNAGKKAKAGEDAA